MIPHNVPYISKKQVAFCTEVARGHLLSNGRWITNFENALCGHLGLPPGHAVVVSSGSAAIYLSLLALGLESSKIALPVYTCSAVSRAVTLLGSTPIYLDCFPDSYKVNGEMLSDDIEGMIYPHMYGIPSKFSLPRKVKVIEDCAQALGSYEGGEPVGLQGDIGIYSFYATKIITSGGHGGACFSRDRQLIDKIRDYINFDLKPSSVPGFNFQMTEIQAACGVAQLLELDMIIRRRKELFNIYKDYSLPLYEGLQDDIEPVRFRAILRTDKQQELIKYLGEHHIKAINPLEDWELLSQNYSKYPVAHENTQNTVSVPIYPQLSFEQTKNIAEYISNLV